MLINESLYVKNAFDFLLDSKAIEIIEEKISDLEFDMSKENPDYSKYEFLEALKQLRDNPIEVIQRYQLNCSGATSFYQLFIDGEKIKMYECKDGRSGRLVHCYNNKKDMEKHFTSLVNFLDNAIFVGRKFERTKPVNDADGWEDFGYMCSEGDIVLYAMQDLFLTYNNVSSEYKLISYKYTLDGKYIFFGPIYYEFKDKRKIYYDIENQVIGRGKSRRL